VTPKTPKDKPPKGHKKRKTTVTPKTPKDKPATPKTPSGSRKRKAKQDQAKV
jgi:hypothetical protein